ncbi:hypothetical protein [Flavobacterium magnum]|nr:hypothetical protein [Flavobacterium magnum]
MEVLVENFSFSLAFWQLLMIALLGVVVYFTVKVVRKYLRS